MHAPDATSSTDTKPLALVAAEVRHPAQVADLIVALPAGDGAAAPILAASAAVDCRSARGARLTHEVPDEDLTVVAARSERATAVWRPLYAVDGAAVAAELQQGLPGLTNVENANGVRVLGESREQMGIVRGGGEAQKGRRVGHCLLGHCRADPTAIGVWYQVSNESFVYNCTRHTSVVLAGGLVDDSAMLQTPEIKHANGSVLAAADKHILAAGTEPHIIDFLVVGDELRLGGQRGDIPDGARRVNARGDDQAGLDLVPVQ